MYRNLKNFTVGVCTAISHKLSLHKLFKLRQRYIFTKSNKPRLRYVASFSVVVIALTVGILLTPSEPMALNWGGLAPAQVASVDPAAGDIEDPSEVAEEMLQSRMSQGMRMASEAIKKPKLPLRTSLEVGRGDTVAGLLESAGLTSGEAYRAVKALSEHFDLRKVKPGQKIDVNFSRKDGDEREFKALNMNISPVKEVIVERQDEESFASSVHEKELLKRTYAYTTEIETSLYGSAARVGIPAQVIAEMIRIYSWNVDFQRDIRRGDKIQVLYEAMETEEGDFARYGDVLFANLSVGGAETPIYRYEMKDGTVDYFEEDGYSVRKTLMKTPIDGARLSSGFGMRHHPVLGYNKMHKGIDFAASTGTPIYAAGDGVIEYIGRKGGYGNYIKLRHNSKLKTAYAHMHKYARGMTKGKRVKQGEVIGYVGTTGRSTGPHLHYEVHKNDVQVNPRSVDLPTGEQLEGEEFKRFKGLMAALNQQYAALTKGVKFASKEDSKSNIN